MLTIIILYFLTRGANSILQNMTTNGCTTSFHDIEMVRLGRIMEQYKTTLPKLRAQYNYDKTLLALCQKYKSNEKTIANLTEKAQKSNTEFNCQLRDAMRTQGDIDELKALKKHNRAASTTDFAYEMAYKNPVARIPAMVSFLAKHMTRTK